MKISKALITGSMLLSAAAFAGNYDRGNHNGKGSPAERTYAVTITNITAGQVFTPVLVATHTSEIGFFELGSAPSDQLADLAEGGATGVVYHHDVFSVGGEGEIGTVLMAFVVCFSVCETQTADHASGLHI